MSRPLEFRVFVPPGTRARSAAKAVFIKGLTGKGQTVAFSVKPLAGWRAIRVSLTTENFDVRTGA